MSEHPSGPRRPTTTWQYAVSAAEQLELWHQDAQAHTGVPTNWSSRARTVVLLAAAVHDWAHESGADGTAVADAPLAAVLRVVEQHPVSALEAFPAAPGTGHEQREQLLAMYGGSEFEAAQRAVRTVLEHHLTDADRPGATIADRRSAMRQTIGRQSRRALTTAFPAQED